MPSDFIKQSDQPLFPEIFWSRPTTRSRAGRLLLVGGQRNRFDLIQATHQLAEAAGIGECQAVLPDSLRRTIGPAEFAHFAPAAASGSLGKAALGELLELAPDFDALVIGLNLTKNAETSVMVESLITKLELPVVITEEGIEATKFHPALITGNPRALVVVSTPGLMALAGYHHLPIAIKPNAGVVGKIAILKQLAEISRCAYVVCDGEVLVAANGEISMTPLAINLFEVPAAAIGTAATFWLQHRTKPFAGLTGAAYVLAAATRTLSSQLAEEAPAEQRLSYTALTHAIHGTLKHLEDQAA